MSPIFTPFFLGDYEVWIEPLSSDSRNYVLHACSHVDCIGSVVVSESDDLEVAIAQRARATDRAIAAADVERFKRVRVRKGKEAA